MNYECDIPYLYGKLNKELEKSVYHGESTETADTIVDNAEMTIKVNVKSVQNFDQMIINFLQNPENTFIIDGR